MSIINTTILFPADRGNITPKDIEAGILRITQKAKPFFPRDQQYLSLLIGGNTYKVNYEKRNLKSDRLHLGKALIKLLQLKGGDHLKITKTPENLITIEHNIKT